MSVEFLKINGGVCAAKGFKANGLNCGINSDKNKNDLGIIYSDVLCNTAAVYTQNKVKGAPIVVTKNNLQLSGNKSKAVIVNSKNANTGNADGIEKATLMCQITASALNIKPEQVIVASTGVIGQVLPIEPIKDYMTELVDGLSKDGNKKLVNAIMTTDTVEKEYTVQFKLDNKVCTLGGIAKGSGMIHPNMATTLNFVTTDVNISSEMLQKALSEVVKITYNCLTVDGDTSTNDMISIMANGLAENNLIETENNNYEIFKNALYEVLMNLTKMLAKDGEGASTMIECTCSGADSIETAITVAKSVVRSPLVKCAIFGADANWGRVLCAVGYAEADFDINKVDVSIHSRKATIKAIEKGIVLPEVDCTDIFSEDEVYIDVNLNNGDVQAKAWGCDLTYDYVKINGDYRS